MSIDLSVLSCLAVCWLRSTRCLCVVVVQLQCVYCRSVVDCYIFALGVQLGCLLLLRVVGACLVPVYAAAVAVAAHT